jgi:hypothetical protein
MGYDGFHERQIAALHRSASWTGGLNLGRLSSALVAQLTSLDIPASRSTTTSARLTEFMPFLLTMCIC